MDQHEADGGNVDLLLHKGEGEFEVFTHEQGGLSSTVQGEQHFDVHENTHQFEQVPKLDLLLCKEGDFDALSKLDENCIRPEISLSIQKSKEDIEEDMFWNNLEAFVLIWVLNYYLLMKLIMNSLSLLKKLFFSH